MMYCEINCFQMESLVVKPVLEDWQAQETILPEPPNIEKEAPFLLEQLMAVTERE